MTANKSSKYNSMDFSGSVFLISEDGQMLSLPIPSQSPCDPLGWGIRKRSLAYIAILNYYITGLVLVMWPGLKLRAFDSDVALQDRAPFVLDVVITAPTLMLGIGAFLWVPLSLAIGRRTVLIICTVLTLFGNLWAATAPNFHQLLGAICIQGLAAGSILSVILLIAIDMTFIHQRPHAITMVWGIGGGVIASVLSIVPIITGSEFEWRKFYQLWNVPCVVSVILVVFFFPETFYIRPPVAYNGRILVQSGSEKVQTYDDWDATPGGKTLPGIQKSWARQYLDGFFALGNKPGEWRAMAACYPQVFMCLCNPLIFWVTILNAVNFAGMMAIGGTYPSLLQAAPYNFTSSQIALVNLAAGIGSLISWPVLAILIQKIMCRLTRRNGGVRHAEYYLPAFILPVLSSALSCILYGLAAEYKLHWGLIYLSYFFNSFAYSGSGAANTLWVTEAFPRWAAPAIIVVGGISYVVSFSMSFPLPVWLASQGYAMMNIEIAILILLVGLFGVPVAFYGQRVRQHLDGRWGAFEAGALRPQ